MRNILERREEILQLVAINGSVQVTQLVPRLGVSAVTIRSDLGALQSQGRVTRRHGGASVAGSQPERQKGSIGLAAAGLIEAGDNILIGSGAMTLALARQLPEFQQLTVMTNGLAIAQELASAPGVELMLTGGRLRKPGLFIEGTQAETFLDAYNFDKLFIGVEGLDLQFGIAAHHEAEANLIRKMIGQAKRVIVLADSTKFGRVGLHRIALLDRIHTVVTDAAISRGYRDELQRQGIKIIIAD